MTVKDRNCQLGMGVAVAVGLASGRTEHVAAKAAEKSAGGNVVLETQSKRRLVDTIFLNEFMEDYTDCLGDIRLGLKATRSASDRLFRMRFIDLPNNRWQPTMASRTEKIFQLYDREPSKTTNEPLISAVVKTGRDWGAGDFLIHDCKYPRTSNPTEVVNLFVAVILNFTARLRLKRLGGLIGQSPPFNFCVHTDEALTHWVTLKCKVKDKNYCIVSNDSKFMDLPYSQLWIPSWFHL